MSEKVEQSRLDELKAQASAKNGWMPAPDMDCDELLALLAERDRLREALKRLGSMEAFDIARAVDKSRDQELLARIDYARAAYKDTNQ